MMLKQPGRDVNVVTINDPLITVPEKQPMKIVQDVSFCSEDYKSQIWPLEEQRRRQLEMALQYDELCDLLKKKMSTRNDHESRGDAIKERLRRKLEESRARKK